MNFLMKNCLEPGEDTIDGSELAQMISLTEPTVPPDIEEKEEKQIKENKPKLTKHSNYTVAVAIDFGTDGSGLAYAFCDGDVRFHNQFKSTKFGSFVKNKTHILLDEDGDFHSFGLDASYSYMTLPSKKQKKYALFQHFKMALYHGNNKKLTKTQKRKSEIKKLLSSFNGHLEIPAEKVFVEALKHLKKEAMKYLKKMKKIKKLTFKNEDIQWILTVPAIWNETAKHEMRDWAKKAGLIDSYKQCVIVLEPDCASLAVQHYVLNTCNSYTFKKGEKYILVDVGGGTADIACHEILTENNQYGVKEIYHPSGGAFGASYIDEEFVLMLEKIFSKEWINEFRMEYANYYVELIHKFRVAKESYYNDNDNKKRNNVHYIELPQEFVMFLDEKCEIMDENDQDIEPEDMFENAQINGSNMLLTLVRPQGIEDNKYFLCANDMVWKYLFDVIVLKIIDECHGILTHSMMKDCKYMILVGGLACNQYYKQRMFEAFGNNKLSIIIPPNPILSVVEGAARFAFQSNYIKARVLSMTYGISASYSLKSCESVNINKQFIETNKFERNKGDIWVDNLFYPLAFKNQTVYLGKCIYYTFMRRNNKTNKVNLQFYCSESDNIPLTIQDKDIHKFASIDPLIHIDFENEKNMDMMIKLIFHDSILRIFAYPKTEYGVAFRERELELEYEHY